VNLLTDASPARCAEMLARDETDAALVPVIEYQRMMEGAVVPHVCVGAREEVRSVVLVTRGAELRDVRTVALDTTSRTSAALVRIIFREFLRRDAEFVPHEPNLAKMLKQSDAALMIGDPAMTFPREGLRVYDLASLWREHTGLGFVFAFWMARENAAARVREIDFAAARNEGLRCAEEIAAAYEELLKLPRAELLAYLRENICYELNEEMREGLELYFRLAYRHGLVPDARPLKFLGA
jgi:chorismate dehydratase